MNIGDNGYTEQYHASYEEKRSEEAIDVLIKYFTRHGMPIPLRDKFSVRPKYKRVDILYNPDTKTFCGLHE